MNLCLTKLCFFKNMWTLKFKSRLHIIAFFADVYYNNCDFKQWTLKHKNTQNGWRSTNHRSQTMTVWTSLSKVLLPKRSAKMIVSSKKCKCQLPFELQSSHVFERFSNFNYLLLGAETSFQKKCSTPPLCNHINSSNLPLLKY